MSITSVSAYGASQAPRAGRPAGAVADSGFAALVGATHAAPAGDAKFSAPLPVGEAKSSGSALAVGKKDPRDGQALRLDTNRGTESISVDDYFSPPRTPVNLDTVPLLMPTPGNIDALSRHASAKLQRVLADTGIPSAPETITFDSSGQAQFPKDYADADRLRQVLDDNPGLARELHTIDALASHVVGMRDSLKYSQDYMAAASDAARDAVNSKYGYLFSNNRHCAAIALTFGADGGLRVTADGKPYDAGDRTS